MFPTYILNANFRFRPSGCCKLLLFSLTSLSTPHTFEFNNFFFFGYHHLSGSKSFDRKTVKFSDAGGVLQEVVDRLTN